MSADSNNPKARFRKALTQAAHSRGDITQQMTSPTPTKQRQKNPKRVAAGKLVAERTRQAPAAQKKAAAEAAVIIANINATATATATERSSLNATQWLAVGTFVISLIGPYYKRYEPKAVLKKKDAQPQPEPAQATPPPKAKGNHGMD